MRRQLFLFFIFNIGFALTAMSQQDGSGFIFDEFKDATIYLSGGSSATEKVNYNTMSKELYFLDQSDGYAKIVSDMERIRIVRVDNRNFIPVREGMHEVLPTTPPIYVEYLPKVQKKGQQVGYGGTSQLTSTNTSTYFDNQAFILPEKSDMEAKSFYNCYWIEQHGKKKKFANFKQFLKIYPKKKDELDEHIKTNNIDFNDARGIADLCLYAESLN